MENITKLNNAIPAMPYLLKNSGHINVKRTVKAISERSPILKAMIEAGEIGIAGGHHDISTGVVDFYENTLIINQVAM